MTEEDENAPEAIKKMVIIKVYLMTIKMIKMKTIHQIEGEDNKSFVMIEQSPLLIEGIFIIKMLTVNKQTTNNII